MTNVDSKHTSPFTMPSAKSKKKQKKQKKKGSGLHTDPALDYFSSLPLDVISTHLLRSDLLPEPGDLGRLRAVSRRMRDAVDATGREIKKLSDWNAMHLGYFYVLKDRHLRGLLENDNYLCPAAAKGGHLEVLKWLRENGCPWDEETCRYAAYGGHFEVLKWARANDCPWDKTTCTRAAEGGQLEVLKWARANGCPWDEDTCAYAALNGHLELLKWARANGCPWSEETRRTRGFEGIRTSKYGSSLDYKEHAC